MSRNIENRLKPQTLNDHWRYGKLDKGITRNGKGEEEERRSEREQRRRFTVIRPVLSPLSFHALHLTFRGKFPLNAANSAKTTTAIIVNTPHLSVHTPTVISPAFVQQLH